MMELWQESIRLANLPYTLFFGVIIAYGLFVVIGALDIELLDFDIDVDADVDVDVDLDIDGAADAAGVGASLKMLIFFNVGQVPVTIWLGVFGVAAWFYSISIQTVLNGIIPSATPDTLRLLGASIVIFPAAAFTAKFVTKPLKRLFPKYVAETHNDYIGKVVTIDTTSVDASFGQALYRKDGNPLILEVRANADEQLAKGDEAQIVGYDKERNAYNVTRAIGTLPSAANS